MALSRCNPRKQTRLENNESRPSFQFYRKSTKQRALKYNNNKQNHYYRIISRIGICLYSIIFSQPIFANSTTIASPSATSSGSVINQGISVNQGGFIYQELGDGIRCSGTTLTVNPFVSKVNAWKDPFEPHYWENIYDDSTDADGNLTNPGGVLYQKKVRTGQARNNLSFNYGVTATISVPLDKRLLNNCVRAQNSRVKYLEQAYKARKLDYALSRLKICAEQLKLGVTYAKSSASYVTCEDVRLVNPPNTLPDHKHIISEEKTTSD
jgi:hypothetical protein